MYFYAKSLEIYTFIGGKEKYLWFTRNHCAWVTVSYYTNAFSLLLNTHIKNLSGSCFDVFVKEQGLKTEQLDWQAYGESHK